MRFQHANYTFAKKISHTADSRISATAWFRFASAPHFGRHPWTRLHYSRASPRQPPCQGTFPRAMQEAWSAKNQLLDRGVPPEIALYLLPNAKSIRLVETGSLLHLLHKWTMRTCFNAQKEIYNASMDEIAQLREVQPQLTR